MSPKRHRPTARHVRITGLAAVRREAKSGAQLGEVFRRVARLRLSQLAPESLSYRGSLLRRGVTRDTLPVGTEIVVDGYQARDYSLLRANGRNVTFPDGRKLLLGSSGPGAPPANAIPTDQAKPPGSR